MKVGVVGVGRLGICFALLLERAGYPVLASDIRTNYVAALNQRKIQTSEPMVAEMLAQSQNFRATTDTREVVAQSDIVYVMVATPSLADGSYDVSAVWRVVDDIKECDFDLTGKILVVGCTTNPGDCLKIQHVLRDRGVHVLYNPEFIAQGSIIRDLQQADMVLIGGEDSEVMERYSQVYQGIQSTPPNIHTMSATAAELVKIGINCFLTTKISFANMLGEVLVRSGLEKDVDLALNAIGTDSRVGSKYLKFGFGFGGPCLPRDNRSFGHYVKKLGLEFNLGETVDAFNKEHAMFLTNHFVWANHERLPFYMNSISYKKNTDIFEESQQLKLCQNLLSQGYTVYVEPSDFIPLSLDESLKKQGDVHFKSREQLVLDDTKFFEIKL